MRANDTNALWLDKESTATTLIHQREGATGGWWQRPVEQREQRRVEWLGLLRPIAPLNKHDQLAFFNCPDQKALDRGFGYSSLRVHMVNMMTSFTDRIKVTLADWRPDTSRLHKSSPPPASHRPGRPSSRKRKHTKAKVILIKSCGMRLQLMRYTPFNGKTWKTQLYFAESLEISL